MIPTWTTSPVTTAGPTGRGGRTARRASPDLVVLGCVDVGPDPLALLGLEPGEAHLMTTAGGVVTWETVRDLVAARRALGVRRVAVVHHRPCAFIDPGPATGAWPPDPVERLRQSLSRLVLPPLGLDPTAVEGFLCGGDGAVVRVAVG